MPDLYNSKAFSLLQKKTKQRIYFGQANVHLLIWDDFWRPTAPACPEKQPLNVEQLFHRQANTSKGIVFAEDLS